MNIGVAQTSGTNIGVDQYEVAATAEIALRMLMGVGL